MKKRELKKGEWFVASENGINKFKHSVKTFFIFVFLPVFVLQVVSAYFILPIYYDEEFVLINQSMNLIFSNMPSSLIKNFSIFALILSKVFIYFLTFLLVTSPLFIFFGMLFFKKAKERSEKLLEEKYIEGSRYLNILEVLKKYCEKRNISFSSLDKEKKLKEKLANEYNCELAGVPLLKRSECAHVLIPGASRKGKSQLFRNVIFKAKEMSKNKKARGLITDEKGEWLSKTYDENSGDLIFNPADARSLKWNIFNDIDNIIDIENYVNWLIPTNEKDPFWTNSAQEILKNILIYLFVNDKKTNKDLRETLDLGSKELYILISNSLNSNAAEMLTKEDSYRTFRTYMKFIDFIEDGDFSIKKWVREARSGFIYITINNKTKALLKPILTLFVNVVSSEILSSKDNYNPDERTYLFLEEFTSLAKLTIIIDLLKLSGSKGCSVWLVFQDFSHIEKIYSKEDRLSIINNCSSLVCLGLNEPESADFFSKKIGETIVQEAQLNHSIGLAINRDGVSIQEKKDKKRLVSESDIINLEKLHCYVKLDDMEGVIFAKIDLALDEAVNEPFIENPNIKNFIPNLIENIENQKNKKKINSLILEDEKEKENEMIEEDSAVEESELNEEINNKATSMPSNLLKGL